MVARTSTWTGSPDALDKWCEHVNVQVKGFIAALPGNAGRFSSTARPARR